MTALDTLGPLVDLSSQAARARAMPARARSVPRRWCCLARQCRLTRCVLRLGAATARPHAGLLPTAHRLFRGLSGTSSRGGPAATPRPKEQCLEPLERHLRLDLSSGDGSAYEAIVFRHFDEDGAALVPAQSWVELAYRLDINQYKGTERVQLVVARRR